MSNTCHIPPGLYLIATVGLVSSTCTGTITTAGLVSSTGTGTTTTAIYIYINIYQLKQLP